MFQLAQKFASLLDQTKYDELLLLMAEDCEYHYWEGDYVGRENIVNIYRQNHLFGKKMFDEVIYASVVERMEDGVYKIHFTDATRIGERWHENHFDEVIGFKDNVICDIQHIQLPGEAESFREFWQSARAGEMV
jgi:hypothetical protein